ncbi:MAG TPA: TIGR03364 family FAD-dependent oxidoreductase [Miltoncostaeaceae bacterium]|nr:TIGR03364 family FAD-dependent oxidoreductase [Miltoncostaeaceae bacterium]
MAIAETREASHRTERVDLAVVGAGIVGLSLAVDAVERGLSVLVIERDGHASGASIRNFGHGYFTAQAGAAREAALEARRRWRRLALAAGFWLVESGSMLLARSPEEIAVIEEFAAERPDEAEILAADEVARRVPVASDGLLGALWTPNDCRMDPREAIPALTDWLARQPGVRFEWGTAALGVEPGRLHTSRGEVAAGAIAIAAGHDLDRLAPSVAAAAGMRRCILQMLRVAPPDDRPIEPALATGLALLRYRGFAECPSLPAVRDRLERERPDLVAADVNLLITQRPDGDLVVGDTHRYALTPTPFRDEALDRLLLDEARALLGSRPLAVRERWLGVYAHSPHDEFLVAPIDRGVRAVAVTSGIGMTTALGLAPRVLDQLLAEAS